MQFGEIIYSGLFIGAAIVVAIAAILIFGLFLQAERSAGYLIVPVFVPMIAAGISVGSLLSNRNLTYASVSIDSINAGTEAAGGGSILRLISFLIIALCGAKILGRLLNLEKQAPLDGKPLFVAYLAFFVANAALNSAFGAHPAFIHNTFYAAIVFTAIYLSRHESLETLIQFAKIALLAMMVLSLAAAVAKPQLAVQPNYKGWVPGLSIRLWGVGSNPNSIGPLALLLLMLESMQPFRKSWLRGVTILIAMVVFVLAQSKTVWVAGFIVVAVVFWYRKIRSADGGLSLGMILAMVLVAIAGTIALSFMDIERIWHKLTLTQAGSDISTLTGRALIWSTALDIWKDNLLFGYGPTAWDMEHRLALAMPFAFSAHNQVLQSLSVAGTFGGITLIGYLLILGIYAFKAAPATRGISLALFASVVFRCMTEAPLAFGTILNGDFLTHLVLFAIALRGRPNTVFEAPISANIVSPRLAQS